MWNHQDKGKRGRSKNTWRRDLEAQYAPIGTKGSKHGYKYKTTIGKMLTLYEDMTHYYCHNGLHY